LTARLSWKLVPLAALFALGLFLLLPGNKAGPQIPAASADHQERLTIVVDSNPETDGIEFGVTVSGASCSPTTAQQMEDDDSKNFECAAGEADVDLVPAGGFGLTNTSCSVTDDGDTTGDGSTFSDLSVGDEDFTVNLTDDEHVTCTVTFTQIGTVTPVATATSSAVAGLSISAAPTSVGCGGSSFITIVVRRADGGNAPDGTPVQIVTNLGTVSPASATTSGGGVLSVYSAPTNQGGTATITATSSGFSGSATLTVN
jgi:hypothetical protein